MRVLDRLIQSIRKTADHNRDIQVAPFCILWPDKERQWEGVLPLLQDALPELLCLGDYAPDKRTGPAIWIRCVLAGCIRDVQLPSDKTPVLYLPGIGRTDLRSVDSCPEDLRPLVPLQFLGAFFSQINSKDWTIGAFAKSSQGGLGLDVSRDSETRRAMQLAIGVFLEEDTAFLKDKHLDKNYFNALLTGGDPVRDVLLWLNDPEVFQGTRTDNAWQAFVELCKSRLGFDPAGDALAGCACLARHEGPWRAVWERFCEAPTRYPHIPDQIRKCTPPTNSMLWLQRNEHTEGWPQWNEKEETSLRSQLLALSTLPEHTARKKIQDLEKEHGHRRSLVWAELAEAPLALALGFLNFVAQLTERPLYADNVEELAEQYTSRGWQADNYALYALAHADSLQNAQAIGTALRSVYLPWLEAAARTLQKLCAQSGYPGGTCRDCAAPAFQSGDCVLFVDGLRYDLGRRLSEDLDSAGCSVTETAVWAALPSVTATGKPRVSPVPDRFAGSEHTADFAPSVRDTGTMVTSPVLKRQLQDAGWTILENTETGDGQGQAWCEFGNIDHEGHNRGWKLAGQVQDLVKEICDRITDLLQAGWKRVHVVTDHGWLLMPGELPKSSLPAFLTENKWRRCALLKEGASCDELLVPWFWNPDAPVALADGISCYKKGEQYAHGGLSFQECLTPRLTVTRQTSAPRIAVQFTDIVWRGLRCKIAVDGDFAGLVLDIRTRPGDARTSLVMGTKPLDDSGKASVVIENEDLENSKAFLVLTDEKGTLHCQQECTIGSTSA